MRIVFTGYAINSATVCLLLSLALMVFGEDHHRFNQCVDLIADYMYIAFGPVLFCFCLFGFASLPNLAYECTPTHIGNRLNLMDVFILLVCAALSFAVLFIYALGKTNKMAEDHLGDESSLFYQAFTSYMKRRRTQYLEDKRRRRTRMENQLASANAMNNSRAEGNDLEALNNSSAQFFAIEE
jgi:hypothetical protein